MKKRLLKGDSMLSVTSWCLLGVAIQDWPRYLNMIHKAGYAGIELNLELSPWPLSPNITDYELFQIKDLINGAGLKITGLSTMIHINKPLTPKSMRNKDFALDVAFKMIEIAHKLNAENISIAPGYHNSKKMVPIINELSNVSANYGVHLLLENVWYSFSREPVDLLNFIGLLADARVGICLDIGNALPYGTIEEWITLFKDKIGKIHISDSVACFPPEICTIGNGQVDWSEVGNMIGKMNYNGDFVLELFSKEGQNLAMELFRISRFINERFHLG